MTSDFSVYARTCDLCDEVKPSMNYIQQLGDEHNIYIHVCYKCQPRDIRLSKHNLEIVKFKIGAFNAMFGGIPRKADQHAIVEI